MGETSNKGAVLDSTIDRIGELFIWAVIGINYAHSNIEIFTVFSILTSSSLIPYLRAKSEIHNIENKVGLAARPERVLFAVFYMYFEFSFNFVYILIFYWTLKNPCYLSYGSIFIAGLVNDVVTGLPIGISSLCYLLICAVTAYLRNITLTPNFMNDWLSLLLYYIIINLQSEGERTAYVIPARE